jgi:hypothetical protein
MAYSGYKIVKSIELSIALFYATVWYVTPKLVYMNLCLTLFL